MSICSNICKKDEFKSFSLIEENKKDLDEQNRQRITFCDIYSEFKSINDTYYTD